MNLTDAAITLCDEPGTYGFARGDKVAYVYRAYNNLASAEHRAEGTVTSVEPGGTPRTVRIHIHPAPGFSFGEGDIVRSLENERGERIVRRISSFGLRARTPISQQHAAGLR